MEYKGRVIIGSDAKREAARKSIIDHLEEAAIDYIDLGAEDNYANIAERVAESVANGHYETGILVCRNGIGMSIAANKVSGIRSVRCTSEQDAYDARHVNDANVMTIGDIDRELTNNIVDKWLATNYSGEQRYTDGLERITQIEARNALSIIGAPR